ncbi:cytochrome c biogenesis protein CcdA [Nakamurella sp. YIM 132084]|uniref:Cytochrome c biogenesis protein CcdA n=1 Tax=Nakamurella leprariae TaxID=2803911 RepID=A0A938YEG9_9ACTN|nr:cytochrome c biogenesis protein CcdA [Nakamurella leprariae]
MAAAPAVTETVSDGPLIVAAALSVAAGFISFASPCVVPLVPGYLSYLAGLVGAEVGERTTAAATAGQPGILITADRRAARTSRRRLVLATGLFVLGFTVVFLAQAWGVLGLAHVLLANEETLMRVGGAVTIVMGLVMAGLVRPLQRERRLHLRPTGRVLGAPLLGAVFALGWTVCLGPTLVGVVGLAGATDWGGAAWRGFALVICYCLGLGLPFLLLAFGFGWAGRAVGVLRRHSRVIQLIGAGALVLLGVLMVSGAWAEFIAWLRVHTAQFGTVL